MLLFASVAGKYFHNVLVYLQKTITNHMAIGIINAILFSTLAHYGFSNIFYQFLYFHIICEYLELRLNSRVIVPTDQLAVSSSAETAKAQASYMLTRCRTEYAPQSAHNVLNTVLKRHQTIFAKTSTSVGRIRDVVHTIHTNPHPPIQRRPYRRPQHEYDDPLHCLGPFLSHSLRRKTVLSVFASTFDR